MPSRSVDIYTIFGTWLIFFSEGEGQIQKKKLNNNFTQQFKKIFALIIDIIMVGK